MATAYEIARWIMEESVRNTTEGNWITYYDEVESRFGVILRTESALEAEIAKVLLDKYSDVILDMVYGVEGGATYPSFDINLALNYCPNYEWHAGDEAVFTAEEIADFDNRTILPLPMLDEN